MKNVILATNPYRDKNFQTVREASTHKEVLDNFVALADELEFKILGLTFSPVKGPEGNIEFLAHLSLDNVEGIRPDTAMVVQQAHDTLDKGVMK